MKEYKYTINGNKYVVEVGKIDNNEAEVSVNGESFKVAIEPEPVVEKKKVIVKPVATKPVVKDGDAGTPLKAPLPGVVIEFKANVGDSVKEGQPIVVLEAMKMNNNLEAECDGVIKEICVEEGQSVMEGEVLVVIG